MTSTTLAVAALSVAAAAFAKPIEQFSGFIPVTGGSRVQFVSLQQGRHYEFHLRSDTDGARFRMLLYRGFLLVADTPVSDKKKVEMEYTPVSSSFYRLVIVDTAGAGEYK